MRPFLRNLHLRPKPKQQISLSSALNLIIELVISHTLLISTS
jgi:hypothetical protein